YESSRPDEPNLGAHLGKEPCVGACHARMFHISNDCNGQAIQRAFALNDCEGVTESLGGVLVLSVTCVQHGAAEISCSQCCRTGSFVAHYQSVEPLIAKR